MLGKLSSGGIVDVTFSFSIVNIIEQKQYYSTFLNMITIPYIIPK
jgi:hypothetical protein